jgi:hypothetical protein
MTYDLTITMNSGPLSGQTATGIISYDSSLAASGGGFMWVDPTDGLNTFSITFLGQTLTEGQIVGYSTGPIVMLNVADLSMLNPFGAWGSTNSTLAPAYYINAINGASDGFTYIHPLQNGAGRPAATSSAISFRRSARTIRPPQESLPGCWTPVLPFLNLRPRSWSF